MTQTLLSLRIDSEQLLYKNVIMHSRKKLLNPRMGPSIFLASSCVLFFSSCALLFPDRTAPKSASYIVQSPGTNWKRLPVGENTNSIDAMKADIAYENEETGAIISLNSLCRKYSDSSLEALTMNLVRGIGSRKVLRQKSLTINGSEALDSLFEGKVDGVKVNINTVVLIKDSCTYDFIYVEVPKNGSIHDGDFQKFLASFRVE